MWTASLQGMFIRPNVSWAGVLGALMMVEELAPDSSGLLSFGDEAREKGGIFVEQRRICWVAADDLKRRLTDILVERTGLSDGELRELYRRCRADRRPIGTALVEERRLAPEVLRQALAQHSAESLLELDPDHAEVSWVPRQERGYQPRFTFTTLEMLDYLAGEHLPGPREEARRELARFEGEGRHGAAFLGDPSLHFNLPLCVMPGPAPSLQALVDLGQWARAAQGAARELGEPTRVTIAATESGEAAAAWWRGPLLFAVRCADRFALAALTQRHMAG